MCASRNGRVLVCVWCFSLWLWRLFAFGSSVSWIRPVGVYFISLSRLCESASVRCLLYLLLCLPCCHCEVLSLGLLISLWTLDSKLLVTLRFYPPASLSALLSICFCLVVVFAASCSEGRRPGFAQLPCRLLFNVECHKTLEKVLFLASSRWIDDWAFSFLLQRTNADAKSARRHFEEEMEAATRELESQHEQHARLSQQHLERIAVCI